ncbi:MAG: peptidoglycan-binding domain-containing protein [bacterium]
MSKIAKKFATIATIITVVAMVVGPVAPAQALDSADLQAQVAALQAQLASLTSQLSTVQNTPSGTTGIPAVCAGISFNRNIARNSVGADVKCLQALLNQLNVNVADTGAGSPGHETTFFGGATRAAVIRFQELYKAECLTPIGLTLGTGFVGTLTRAKLNGLLVGGIAATFPAGCTSASGYSTVTGLSCATGAVTPPVLPAGCTSSAGYSPTTGQSCATGAVTPPVVVTGVVTASLASDNPVSASIVSDAGGSQSIIPMLKVNLSNGTASEIKVTSLKFLRSGISADSDLSQAYIYDGDTKLAEYNSFSSSVLTFTNSAGVVIIPANSVKTITLKVDLANGTAAGKTINFSINAATDIVSNASSVGGVFPITGNNMSTALVTDLGELDVTMVATPATPDPGVGVEVFKFTLADTNQKIELRRLVFSNIGTVAYTDLANFQLLDGATPVGSIVASANSDKTVVMDLATPLVIDKGITKTMTLKADVVAGTARTYRFSFQNMSDVVAYDAQYKVFIKPNQSDSWTIVNGTEATIQSGKVTVSRSTDSPQGNISSLATNVVLAKYKIKASGEDVKISDLTLKIYGTIAAVGMYQTAIYYDGSQIGQTTTTMNSGSAAANTGGTTFSFGNTFVLPAGVEKVIEIRSDVKTSAGGTITSGSTLTGQISAFTATGKTSAATVTIGSVTGYQLTVSAGTMAVTKNQAVPSWTATYPTGVAGGVNVLIGSFILTAGSGEGANITGISAQIASTSVPGTANTEFQNVRIFKGTYASGVQLGSALNSGGTPTASTTYTVYPSPYLALAKAESVTLNVYADILTGADTNNIRQVVIGPVYGTGLITNTSIDSSGWVSGQDAVVSAGGYVGAAIDVGTPVASLVVAGSTGVEFAKWKLSASSSPEAMSVTGLIATTTLTTATVSSVSNLVLSATIDGVASSWTGVTLTGLAANERADFGSLMTVNPLVIPAGKEAVVTLKADVASWPTAPSGGVVTFALASTTWKGEGDPTSVTVYAVGNAQTLYKSKPTVTLTAQPLPGGTFSDGTQTLIKFRIAADAKGAIDLQRVNIKVAVNDIATTTSNLSIQDISLYEVGDTTVLNDRVSINATATAAYTDYSASSTVADSIFGGALTGDPLSKTGNILLTNNDGSALTQIGAGSYVDFEVKATIAGSAQYDTMTFSLDDLSAAEDNAIKWGDTITSVIPSTSVKTIPTNTWSYTR